MKIRCSCPRRILAFFVSPTKANFLTSAELPIFVLRNEIRIYTHSARGIALLVVKFRARKFI